MFGRRATQVIQSRVCSSKSNDNPSVSYKLSEILQKIEDRSAERIKAQFDRQDATIRGEINSLRGEINSLSGDLRGEMHGLSGEVRGQSKVYAFYGMIIGSGIGLAAKIIYDGQKKE